MKELVKHQALYSLFAMVLFGTVLYLLPIQSLFVIVTIATSVGVAVAAANYFY